MWWSHLETCLTHWRSYPRTIIVGRLFHGSAGNSRSRKTWYLSLFQRKWIPGIPSEMSKQWQQSNCIEMSFQRFGMFQCMSDVWKRSTRGEDRSIAGADQPYEMIEQPEFYCNRSFDLCRSKNNWTTTTQGVSIINGYAKLINGLWVGLVDF